MAAKFGSRASAGFATTLRKDMFYNIQNFSFANIDKFSTPSLVTRLTTDVTNVQQAFMMIIRIGVRAPLMMAFAMVISFTFHATLPLVFLIVVPIWIGHVPHYHQSTSVIQKSSKSMII